MTLRKVPGAIALGLLASLVGHTAVYGGDHAMGGPWHLPLLSAAAACAAALLAIFGALAWTGAKHVADGSVLAARLTERLPSLGGVIAACAGWFWVAEHLEPAHAPASLAIVAGCLIAAACALLALTRGAITLLSRLALAIARQPYASRRVAWRRHRQTTPVLRPGPRLRRRFARPPPSIVAARA